MRKRPWLVLSAAVFAIPTIITLNLKHAGEQGIAAQVQLAALTTDVRILDGIERRLINGSITWRTALADIGVAHLRAHGHLAQAGILGLPPGPQTSIEQALHHYYLELDQQVSLISTGKKAEAAKQDETKVGPAFTQVTSLLDTQSQLMKEGAQAAQRRGDIGLLVTVLLSLMLISFVQSRRRRAEVLGQARRHGDARYRALIHQSLPFQVEGVGMQVEASVGVVISGEHGTDAITLMQRADIAMYVAKTQHLGVFVYDPGVDGNSAGKLALVWDLRRALDRGELVMYYQAKINVTSGELVGAEALVRWRHPEQGPGRLRRRVHQPEPADEHADQRDQDRPLLRHEDG
jgi:hypothetical protein